MVHGDYYDYSKVKFINVVQAKLQENFYDSMITKNSIFSFMHNYKSIYGNELFQYPFITYKLNKTNSNVEDLNS